MKLNDLQKFHLDQMQTLSFNNFQGPRVVRDLFLNLHLWKSALMFPVNQGVALREAAEGDFYADTLVILPAPGMADKLLALAEKWDADEVEIKDGADPSEAYLRLWWD